MTKEGHGGPFFAQTLPAAAERAPMPLRPHPWSAREQQFSDRSGSDSLAFGPKHEKDFAFLVVALLESQP